MKGKQLYSAAARRQGSIFGSEWGNQRGHQQDSSQLPANEDTNNVSHINSFGSCGSANGDRAGGVVAGEDGEFAFAEPVIVSYPTLDLSAPGAADPAVALLAKAATSSMPMASKNQTSSSSSSSSSSSKTLLNLK